LILYVVRNPGGVLLELLFGVVDVLVGFILQVDDLLLSLVSFCGSFSLFDHSVDVGVAKTTATLNLDALRLSSGLVFGRNMNDTVSINVKGNFNLRVSARSHRDALKFEVTKLFVIFSELTLSLKNADTNLGLVVGRCGEYLTLLGGDGCVTGDELGADASHCLDTER